MNNAISSYGTLAVSTAQASAIRLQPMATNFSKFFTLRVTKGVS